MSGSPTLRPAPTRRGRHQRADRDLRRQGRRLRSWCSSTRSRPRMSGTWGILALDPNDPQQSLVVVNGGTITERGGQPAPTANHAAVRRVQCPYEAEGRRSTGTGGDHGGPAAQEPGVRGHGARRRDVRDGRRDRADGDVQRGGDGGHGERHAVADAQGGGRRTGRARYADGHGRDGAQVPLHGGGGGHRRGRGVSVPAGSIALNGGTLKDAAANDATTLAYDAIAPRPRRRRVNQSAAAPTRVTGPCVRRRRGGATATATARATRTSRERPSTWGCTSTAR